MPISWLSETTRQDVNVAGGKGANLGEMTQLGLPVPDGFCLTADTYQHHMQAWGLGEILADALRAQDWKRAAGLAEEACTTLPLEEGTIRETLDAYRRLGGPTVAVRSSATAEDLAEASFAGQQETFLNVVGEAALLDAVRRCWASLWSPRALHYRHERGIDHLSVAMAVVIQVMVPAEAAGVLFTVDPVAQRADRLLIQAARGLGEAVVSGSVTGDSYAVDRTAEPVVVQRDVQDPQQPVLTESQVLELSRIGLALESHFGAPQDLEFALAAGRMYLLQSRPITTLTGTDLEDIPPLGTLTPFQRSLSEFADERYPVAPKPLDNYVVFALMGAPVNAFRRIGLTIPTQVEKEWLGRIWREGYVYPPARPNWRLAGAGLFMIRMLRQDWQAWWDQGPRQEFEKLSADRSGQASPPSLAALSNEALLEAADRIRSFFRAVLIERFEASTRSLRGLDGRAADAHVRGEPGTLGPVAGDSTFPYRRSSGSSRPLRANWRGPGRRGDSSEIRAVPGGLRASRVRHLVSLDTNLATQPVTRLAAAAEFDRCVSATNQQGRQAVPGRPGDAVSPAPVLPRSGTARPLAGRTSARPGDIPRQQPL